MPKVMNRRKYPRLSMKNDCEILMLSKNLTLKGQMVKIKITIDRFDLLKGEPLNGIIIRSSDNDGTFFVGCRMPADHSEIEKYVQRRFDGR